MTSISFSSANSLLIHRPQSLPRRTNKACLASTSSIERAQKSAEKIDTRPSHVLSRLRKSRLLLCVRTETTYEAEYSTQAAISGGISAVSVSLRTPDPYRVIRRLREQYPQVLVGASGVLTRDQATRSINSGAQLTLSPIFDPELLRFDTLHVPAVATPTEAHNALRNGARVCKLFPSQDVSYISAIGRALPAVRLLPTSGIRLGDVRQLLELRNVHAVGVSSQILSGSNAEEITSRARLWVETAAANAVGNPI